MDMLPIVTVFRSTGDVIMESCNWQMLVHTQLLTHRNKQGSSLKGYFSH